MKKCSSCGSHENPDDAMYCGRCGKILPELNQDTYMTNKYSSQTINIAKRIIEIIGHDFDYVNKLDPIKIDTPFISLDFDSLDSNEFLLTLEEGFDVKIKDEDAVLWTNLLDIAEFIHQNKSL